MEHLTDLSLGFHLAELSLVQNLLSFISRVAANVLMADESLTDYS